MKSAEDIESFLIRREVSYEQVRSGMWLVKDEGPDLVLSISDSVLVFRVKVMEAENVPEARREALYRTLLELNATEMIHGAYGLEQGAVVLTDALQLENLDFNEFQAALEDIGMAISKHYPVLAKLVA